MKKVLLFFVSVSFLMIGCHKDLDKLPPNTQTSEDVYRSEDGYKQVLAKVYGSMALTGNAGPAGAGDVVGIDEGNSDFLRLFWNAQELTSDQAIVAWDGPLDVGLQDLQQHKWRSSNPLTKGLYYRSIYIITLCNEFIRQSTSAKLSERGISADAASRIAVMQSEARFVRAFQYWVLMDIFGNPAFITDDQGIGAFRPKQIKRGELYDYIEKELLELASKLPEPRANEYGRADRAAVWSLLARIYLNADIVYNKGNQYNKAVEYASKVINSNRYSIENTNYRWLFLADNSTNGSQNEFIWTLNYDGVRTQNFGGTTYLVNSSVGGNMDVQFSGGQDWAGNRARKPLVQLFEPNVAGNVDTRANFFINSQSKSDNDVVTEFKDGYGVLKYRNRTRADGFGSDPDRRFSDIDFPVFRLAEMYFIYAEGVARGATNGTKGEAKDYINKIRFRAYGNTSGNILEVDINTDFLLDEKGREFYWEAHRRTDLIRNNKYLGASYVWPWKAGVKSGAALNPNQNLMPLPDAEIASNPNIIQNTGY